MLRSREVDKAEDAVGRVERFELIHVAQGVLAGSGGAARSPRLLGLRHVVRVVHEAEVCVDHWRGAARLAAVVKCCAVSFQLASRDLPDLDCGKQERLQVSLVVTSSPHYLAIVHGRVFCGRCRYLRFSTRRALRLGALRYGVTGALGLRRQRQSSSKCCSASEQRWLRPDLGCLHRAESAEPTG